MNGSTRRLWVVSDIYYPEDVSTGHVMTRIAEGLSADAEVMVVSGRPAYAKAGTVVPRKERRNGTSIRRLGLFAFPKDRLLLRALNVGSFTLSALIHLALQMRRGDRVLCVTNPPTLAPLLALIARWKGAHFVLLVHDVFPETAVAAGKLAPSSWIYRLLQAAGAPAWRSSAAVIVLGRDMARLIAAKRGSSDGIAIVENWADLDEVIPLDRAENAFLADLGWSDRRVIQFSGNLGRTHGVETLVEAARSMSDDTEWRWLFAGFGGKEQLVAEAARGAATVAYLPRQPRMRLPELLGAADVHVIAFVPGMAGLSVPSRMYNIMAAGRPIIAVADRESELSQTLLEEDIGWQVEPGDWRALVDLLQHRLTPSALAERGVRARAVAERRFSFSAKLAAIRAVLELEKAVAPLVPALVPASGK